MVVVDTIKSNIILHIVCIISDESLIDKGYKIITLIINKKSTNTLHMTINACDK